MFDDGSLTFFYWIEGPWAGRLAITARPRGGDWLAEEIQGWRRAAVNTVVSALTVEEVADFQLEGEAELCRAAGIDFVSFPVPDRGVPASAADFARLLPGLGGQLAAGKTVAAHCRAGIGRSTILAAGLLLQAGVEAAAAFERIRQARGGPVPDTPEQRQWVEAFARKHLVSV